MSAKTSIILCTYNEEKYIENIISELEKHIPSLELVIVDDLSTDGTTEIIKKLNHNNRYKVVFRKKSRSLASAFVRGIIETTGDYIGWVDANMSELAPKFNEMIAELKAGNDLIILSRYIDGGEDRRILLRSLGSKYFNLFSRVLLRIPIKDLTNSIFLMKREVLSDVVPVAKGHGEFMIEFLYKAEKKGNKILEIPYIHPVDLEGNSKSFPNIARFIQFGFFYFVRIIQLIIRE